MVALAGGVKSSFAAVLMLLALRSRTITTLAAGPTTGNVSNIPMVAGSAGTAVLATAPATITISSLRSGAVGAGLTAAISAVLTTATTTVTSTTAEATTMAPTTLTTASAVASAATIVTI